MSLQATLFEAFCRGWRTRRWGAVIAFSCLLIGLRVEGSDVVADFSTNANPNGVWSYGWATVTGNAPQLATTAVEFQNSAAVGWGNGLSLPDTCVMDKDYTNFFTSGTVAFYPDTLHLDPQSYAVMARFMAPSNGSYQVSGLFRLQDNGTQAHDLTILVNGNTTNYHVLTSGGSYNTQYPFNFATALTSGGTLDFVVGCHNGAFNNLGTGLKATITNAIGTVFTWTGAASSDWFNPTNWSPQGTPGSQDTAVINSGSPAIGTAAIVGSVALGSNGTLNAGAGLTVSNQFNWTGGSLAGELIVVSNATLNLNYPGGNLTLSGATIVNNGTAIWDGGTLYGNQSTVVTNNGLWLAQTDDLFYNPYGGGAAFYNNGIFTKTPSTGTTTFNGFLFDNSGTVKVNSGALTLSAGGVLGGAFQAAANTTVTFSGGGYLTGSFTAAASAQFLLTGGSFTYGPSVDFTSPGANRLTGGAMTLTNSTITNLAIDGGTITLSPTFQNGSITNLTMVSATLAGTNTVTGTFDFDGTINGALTVVAGASCYITNLSLNGGLTVATNATLNLVSGNNKTLYGSTLVNNGVVVWDGGTIYYNQSSVITNNGAWLAETDDQIYNPYGGAPVFYNNGILTKSPTTGSTTFYGVALDNTGTVNVQTGTLNLSDGGEFLGTFLAASGATLNFSGGGYLDGTDTAATNAQILFSGGAFTYGSGLDLTGPGGHNLTGGSLTLTNNVIPNLAMNGGTVTLGANFQGGTITNFTLTGSTLAGSNALTGTMHWQSGAIAGVFTVASNAVLYLDGYDDVYQYATLTNAGRIIWNGSGNWRLYDDTGLDGAINNLANAIIDIDCNQSLYPPNGSQVGWLNNAGLVRKSLSAGVTTISVTLTNTGTVDLLTGTLNFGYGAFGGQFLAANGTAMNLGNGGVLSGAFTAGEQAVVDLTGGAFTQSASVTLAGSGNYLMTGSSTLTALNTLIPNLQMTGGVIDLPPGFQGGSITNLTLNGPSLGSSNLVTGSLTINGNINGPLLVASNATLTWNGTVNGQITAMPGATLNWNGGNISTPLFIPSNAVLNATGISYMQTRNWLTNAGTIHWTGGSWGVLFNYGIYNLAGAAFNIECDQTLSDYYGNEFFNNAGLLRKLPSVNAATTGATSLDLVMENTGVVDVQDGALNFQNFATNSASGIYQCESNASMDFNAGGIFAGAYTAAAGGYVDFGGGMFTITPSILLNGPGSYQITAGTLLLTNGLIPNLQMAGGVIDLPPGFQGGSITNLTLNGPSLGSSNLVTGSLTINGNINGPLLVASNATLTWNGTVNGQITAMPGATLNWNGGNISTPLFIPSNAVLNATGISYMQTRNWLTNAGTIHWTGGSWGVLLNYGIYNLAGAAFNIECDQTLSDYYGNEFFNNAGLLRKLPSVNAATTGATSLDLVMENTGLVDVQDGTLNFGNYVTNAPAAVVQCESNAAVYCSGGAAITGAYTAAAGGAMVFSGGAFDITAPFFFNGAGSYEFTGGTLTLTTNLIPNLQLLGGNLGFSSSFQGGGITNLNLNGLNIASSNLVTGSLTINGNINGPLLVASNATLTWNGTVNGQLTVMPGATLNWNGGNIYTPLFIPSNAVLNATGVSYMQTRNWLTNAGTIHWTGGSLGVLFNYGVYNLAGAVFNIECDQTLSDYYGNEFFNNAGVLRKAGTGGATGFQLVMNNTGVIDAESGQLNFLNSFNQTAGAWEIGVNGSGNNGLLGFSGTAPLGVNFSVHLNNGYILGLSNSFTLLNYPSFSGAFASTNLPAAGASWNLTVGATATTLLLTNLDTPQNVAITSPANNQSFVIPVNIGITATATDPYAAISSVQFYQGTNLLGQAIASPFTFTWNSVQPGSYALSVLALDAAGAAATSAPVNITVYYNHAQTTNYTWTGAVSGDWFTAGNWSPNGIPGALDNVSLANSGTINLANNVNINNFTLTSGTLGGAGILTVTNTAAWDGGTVAGWLNMATNSVLTISGNVTLNGSLVNGGTVNWPSGGMNGNASATITNNGLWLSQSGNQVNLYNGLFVNDGTLRVAAAGGRINLNNPTFVNNGTVDADSGSIYFNGGGTLAGTYNAAATGAVYFNGGTFALGALPNLTGSGVLEFSGGTLNAAFTVPAVLQLAGGTVVPGPVFQHAGAITNLTIAGATLSGTNTVTGTMNWTAGYISGQLTVASTGLLNMSSGSDKYMSGSSLLNSGQVIWTGGNLRGDAHSAVTNNGVWLDETDGQISFGQGSSIFVNNDLFQKTNSTGTTYFYSLSFVNNGTVDAGSGVIAFEYGGTLSGTYNAATGAAINFAGGTFTIGSQPALAGAGTIRLTGGTMNIASNIPPNLQLSGGTFTLGPSFQNGGEISYLTNNGATLAGAYTVTGTLTWLSGAASGSLTIATNATLKVAGSAMDLGNCALTNNGIVEWTSGPIHGNSATVVVNNGLWLALANNYFDYSDGGNFSFLNNGTLRNTSGATQFSGVSFINAGLVDIEGGSVNFNGGGTLGGTYNTAPYCDLYFSGGSFTAGAPPAMTGAGLSEFTGGTLTLLADQIPNLLLMKGNLALGASFQNSGAITNLTISGCTLTGTNTVSGTLIWAGGGLNGGWLTVATNALLNFTTGNDKNLGNSILLNNGTVAWSGGTMHGNSGTFITNNGLWLIQNDNTIDNNICCGDPTFVNNGTLAKSGTYGATTVNNVSLFNFGTLDIESGTINLVNSATYGQAGATLEFGVAAPSLAGQLAVPGPVSLDGTLNVHFLNGYTPNVGDLLQPVFYGSGAGTFANLDLPPLAAGQSWDLEYGSASISLSVIAPSTVATNTLVLSGSVTGPGHTPISGVTVYATLNGSNLIQNGSFEAPSIDSNPYKIYALGSTNIPGWTVIGRPGANVALTSLYWEGPAQDGDQFFDPTGNTGGGGIAQSFPTVPGTIYDLIFYHGTYSHQGIANCLAVTLGANYYTFGETSGGAGNLDWRQVVIPFTAASNLTTLSFSDNTGINADDNLVDNVQVIQPGADTVAQTVTDASGNYQLTVPNGTLVAGVSGLAAAGYNPVPTQTVTMSNANQVVNFSATPVAVAQQFTITTAASPAGAGTVSGGGAYSSGAVVTVNATAITTSLPYSFSSWTENGVFQSASPSYSFTAIRDRDLVANFVLPVFAIAATNNPPTAGTVAGAGSFSYGTTNVLTAYPNFGYIFANWTEGANIVGSNVVLTTVVLASHAFVANYTAANVTHVVTTATAPPGLASVAGAGSYTNGQTAHFSAPLLVTNAPNVYEFQQFTLSNTLASSANTFSKTFSTLDPTNLQYVAVYAAQSILPLLTNVSVNYSPLVPSTTNFILGLQFDRSMRTNVAPLVVLTNGAASIQPVVASNGAWSSTVLNHDTYATPPITIAAGMDGTMQLYVSGAQDTNGDTLALTNAAHFTVEATAPPNPVLTAVSSNSSSITVGWSSYNAPAALAGFHVYLQTTNYSSAAGLSAVAGLSSGARSFQFNGLSLDTPYFVAVQAVDTAGNSRSAVTPLEIILSSSLPPAVGITVSATGASSALISWNGYSTAGLLGFAGFYVYYQQTNFTTVAGLTPQATLGPSQSSFQANGLDRTKTNYFAVVGFNAVNHFYASVFTVAWTDPYAGTIGVNTTIGGVVPIFRSMVVASNATLTIQPGATLLFAPGTSLTVAQGTLTANGTALAPIVFDSANDVAGGAPAPGDWGGVALNSGAGGSSLRFVEILYGAGLTLNGCSPSVQALTANFNTPSGLRLENGATLTTASALVSGNQVGVLQSDTAVLNVEGSVIQNNLTNAWAAGSAALNAVSNWWGTATQGGLAPLLAGNVSYSPFLTSEPVLTPAIGTSNGVTQVGSSTVVLQLACRTATSMRLSEDYTFSGVFFVPFSNYAAFPLSAGGGLKHIFAQFRSVTGQTNSPVEVDVTYITAGPVIASFNLSDGETLPRPLTVTGTATAVLGMQDIEFYVDGVGLSTNAGGSLSYYFDVRPLSSAVHQVELLARDTAGNIATLEEGVVVAVTPPQAPTLTTPGADYVTNNSSLGIRGTAEENINIQVTDNTQVLGTTTADASGNFGLPNVTLTEGANPIIAVASDRTGQTSSQARHVTVETIAPAALVMNQPVYNPGVGINLGWNFAVSGKQADSFQVFWGSAAFATTNQATGHSLPLSVMSYIVQGLANGTYYFGVVGFDLAGNPSPLSGLVSIVYNGTPPSLSIAYGTPSPVGVGALGITLASSEALAATPSLTIQPSGAPSPISLTLTNVALNTWQSALMVSSSTPSGVAAVTATARDQAGNVFSGAPSGPALVIDTTPPSAAIVTAPPGPVQTTSNAAVAVDLTITKPPAAGTTPTLSFAPPQGTNLTLSLTGTGTNWNATLPLTAAMGSGFGNFAFSSKDGVGNVGTNITAGAQLELYNTTHPSPPPPPTNLTAKSLPGGYIALSWNAVGNAQNYRLYREPGTNFLMPATLDIDNLTATTVTDLPPADGLYSYGISASRLGSESAISNVVIALSDRTPPPAPTNVQVQLAANGVQITWQEPAGQTPDHYNIYRNGSSIQTVSGVQPVMDYPPRGTNTYVVSASDAIGNESPSAPVALRLLVGPVGNLSALVVPGQTPVLMWTSSDATVAGFNVYRNGVKQNAALLSSLNFTDSLPMVDIVQYGVSAVNGSGQESPQRVVSVQPIAFGLLVNPAGGNTSHPVLSGYFDQLSVSITNLSATAALSLSQLSFNRTVAGTTPLAVTQALTSSINAGASLQQSIVVPEATVSGPQIWQVSATQQADNEGDSVTYRQTFAVTNSTVAATEIAVSVNQLPLAGGLTPFQVQIFNRAYIDLQLVVERGNGQQPGDLYISVRDSSGQEVSRTPFQGAPPGSFFRADGSAYVTITAGSSLTVTVPNVLTPAALAGTTNVTFVAVASAIYNQIGTPQQTVSGPLQGSMVSSLAQTPYYGTAQTDQNIYTNDQPVVISGQAINRTTGLAMPNAALNLGFATRGFAWNVPVTTDAGGNYQYIYNAPPGFGGTLSLWAAHPLVVDQLNQAQIVIDRVYANPSTGDIQMSKNGTLNFSIQLFNPGDVPLTGLATSFKAYQVSGTNLTPLTKITGTNLNGSGFSLDANQSQTVHLELGATIDAPNSAEIIFTFTSAEGASATFTATVNLAPAVPVLAVARPAAGYLEVSVNRGNQLSGQIVIVNEGLTDLRGITVVPPTNSWISLNLPVSGNGSMALPDLPVGQSNSVTVVFSPPATQALAFYQDTVTIQGTNLSTPFPIAVAAIVTSDLTGGVQFYVDDILGETLSGAAIRLNNNLISANAGPFYTDTNGLVTISNLEEGTWNWQASAPGCSASAGTVDITADQTAYQHARLNRSLVTVTFSVVPVPFSDSYTVQITETYQTHVPMPVLVATPLIQEFDNVTPGFQATYNVTVQNQGLAQMQDLTLSTFQNGQCSYQPLISYIPAVLPQQSIDVPYTVTYWGSNAPGPQGGNAGCLSAVGKYFTGYSDALADWGAFITSQLLVADSILDAFGVCPTDNSHVALGVQAAANLYSTAEGLGLASPANQAAAMAAYLQCLLGGVESGPFGNSGFSAGGPGFAQPQLSGPSFQTTGGGCLASNTRVLMADGTEKLIADLAANDMVRSGLRTDNVARVAQVCAVDKARVFELRLRHLGGSSAPSVLTTQEHLFWVDGKGWTPARELNPGDWLSNSQGAPIEIVQTCPLDRLMKVYTLRLEMDNAFFANDLLVHDLCGGRLPSTVVSTSEAAK